MAVNIIKGGMSVYITLSYVCKVWAAYLKLTNATVLPKRIVKLKTTVSYKLAHVEAISLSVVVAYGRIS